MPKKHFHIPVFVYEDYVAYLDAWYSYTKRFGYTQRRFLEEAGIKTQAFFSDILTRRKKIGRKHIAGFIRALELDGDAAAYFTLLVQKEVCKDPKEKEQYFRQLVDMRRKNLSAMLENKNLEYFASWVYPVIREYIAIRGVVASPKEIVNSLDAIKLSMQRVKDALKKLEKWRLIAFDAQRGGYVINESPGIITYQHMPHAVVNDAKREMIETAIYAMETLPADERHVSMAIRGVDKTGYVQLCAKIDALRQELLEMKPAGPADRVIALTVQAFPVMKAGGVDRAGAREIEESGVKEREGEEPCE